MLISEQHVLKKYSLLDSTNYKKVMFLDSNINYKLYISKQH